MPMRMTTVLILLFCTASIAAAQSLTHEIEKKAQRAYQQHAYDKAAELYLQIIDDPNLKNPTITCFQLAESLRFSGHTQQSLPYYLRTIQQSPDSAQGRDSYIQAAKQYKQNGDSKQALVYIDEGLSHHPGTYSLINEQVTILRQQGHYEQALKAFSAFDASFSDKDWYINGKIELLLHTGKTNDAIRFISSYIDAAKQQRNTAWYYRIRAGVYAQAGMIEYAAADYKTAYADTGNTDDLFLQGGVYAHAGQKDKALEIWQSFLKNNETPTAYAQLAELYRQYGFYDEAIQVYLVGRKKFSTTQYDRNLQQLYEVLGRYDDLLNEYIRALRENNDQKMHKKILTLAHDYDQYALVEKKLTTALAASADESTLELIDILFSLLQQRADYAKAAALISDYKDRDSITDGFIIACGDKLSSAGALKEAAILYRIVIAAPKIIYFAHHARSALAGVYLKQRSYTKAITLLNTVLEAEPNNAHARYLLGYALQQHGDYEAALTAYKKAAPVYPNAQPKIAELYICRENWHEALQTVKAIAKNPHTRGYGVFLRGEIYLQQLDISNAAQAYRAAADNNAESDAANDALMRLVMIQNILPADGDTTRIRRFADIIQAQRKNNHDKALRLINDLRSGDSPAIDAIASLLAAQTCHTIGNIPLTLSNLNRVIHRSPITVLSSRARELKGFLYETELSDQKTAYTVYRDLLVHDPTYYHSVEIRRRMQRLEAHIKS